MTTYILDIKTKEYSINHDNIGQGPVVEYYFKIDNNGNVDISKFEKCRDGRPIRQGGGIEQVLKINDNIPIPNYFIDIINFLINPITINDIVIYEREKSRIDFNPNDLNWLTKYANRANSYMITERYLEIVVTTIKRIKENVKKIVENPQDTLDIKTQLDTFISKTKLQQENKVELEKKIENIQTAYFDTLNDNKNLKGIIKEKDNKQTELECEINRLLQLQELNSMKQLEKNNEHEKAIPIKNYMSHPYQDKNNDNDDNDYKQEFYHNFSDPWKVRNDVENNGHIVSKFGEVFSPEQIKYYKKIGHNIISDVRF